MTHGYDNDLSSLSYTLKHMIHLPMHLFVCSTNLVCVWGGVFSKIQTLSKCQEGHRVKKNMAPTIKNILFKQRYGHINMMGEGLVREADMQYC